MYHAITDGRNAQRPLASIALRYPHSQKGLGGVFARHQFLPQRFQPVFLILVFDPLECFAIDSCRSRVGAATAISFQQNIFTADLVP
jgi:hypothetical protein